MSEEVFVVPRGSDSVCYWCKGNDKCDLFTGPERLRNALWRIAPSGRFAICPFDEFEPDESTLPEQFKGRKIVLRYRSSEQEED